MRPLFLNRLWYQLLRWNGRPDARPTEFAATELTVDQPVSNGSSARGPEASEATAGRAGAAPTSAPLTHIGRYEIKGRLGAGGLGEVFDAWDPLLSRNVAVKTLRLQLDPELRALLDDHILNEARAAAGLSHPNIVTVFDAGLCAPGVYIAMERLHGRDLRQALAQGWRPTPLQAAQLARRVAEALAYAHDKGVVHCDIKPGNIFLDAFGRPKVLDFGIARIAQDKSLPVSNEPLFGSPHYLAPEQLQQGQADARTDVRALGVVLYEMLTGRKAYAGDTVEQVVNAVLLNHPAPAHEVHERVPRTLSAIAARAMAREPAQRYPTAEAMASDLRGWCDRHAPRPSEAPTDDVNIFERPAGSSPRAPHRTRRAGLGWVVAGGAVCVAAVAWLWWLPGAQLKAADGPGALAAAAPDPTVSRNQSYNAVSAAGSSPASKTAAKAPTKTAPKTALKSAPKTAATSAEAASANGKTPRQTATARRTTSAATSAAATPGNGAVLLSISPWGEVEVNGQRAGTTPPLTRLSLPAGRHTITVKNDDFPAYTTTVQVQADKPALVRYRFTQ